VSNSSQIGKTAKLATKPKLSASRSAQDRSIGSIEFDPDQLEEGQAEVDKWFTAS
jgi:hypothetical protein